METPIIRPNETKWRRTRQCACGDCRFFSEQERPKCPAMEADPKLKGEWLWVINPGMLGCKDYIDPLDFAGETDTVKFIEKEPILEPTDVEIMKEPIQEQVSEVARITVDKSRDK